MPDSLLDYGQMLAVVVIVGGVAIALGRVWILVNRLGRRSDRQPAAAPSQRHAIERAADERILRGANDRAPGRAEPSRR